MCHGHTCAHTSLACRAVKYICITSKEYWHQLGCAHVCIYIATHDWLQPKTDFHRIVSMYYVVIRKVGRVVHVKPRIQKLRLGEMQFSIVRKHTEPVEPGPYWHTWRGLKCLYSCIPPLCLRCCTTNRSIYLGMLSTKLLGNWPQLVYLRMTRFYHWSLLEDTMK